MWPDPQFPTDLVPFTEEIVSGFGHIYWKIFNGKLHFLCSDTWYLILEYLILIFKEMY